MAIRDRSANGAKAKPGEAFIGRVPDRVGEERVPRKGVKKGNKEQISLTISPDMLARVDSAAAALGISRAAYVNQAVARALTSDGR